MCVRVVRARFAPDRLDEAIRLWREAVAPTPWQQPGFKNARLLVQRETGQVMSMDLWETDVDFQTSVAWNAAQLAKFAALFAAPPW